MEDNTVFPKGFYCYEIRCIAKNGEKIYIETSPCPFYIHKEGIDGYCSSLNVEVVDSVKECGINEFTDEEIEELIKE